MSAYRIRFLDSAGRTTRERMVDAARFGQVFDLLLKIEWPTDTVGFCLLDPSGQEIPSDLTGDRASYAAAML